MVQALQLSLSVMKTLNRHLYIKLALLFVLLTSGVPAHSDAGFCRALFAKDLTTLLDAKVLEPAVYEATIQSNIPNYRILAKVAIPPERGGGEFKLVSLNLGSDNRAYNHQEVAALTKVHPEMAKSLGFHPVEGNERLVWVPDVERMNYLLEENARAAGYTKAIYKYEPALGVISTLPYVNNLAKGRFPFSGEADVNLSVHDSLHSVALNVMNTTRGGRKILRVSTQRNRAIVRIYNRLKEINASAANSFLNNHASNLAPDNFERTMLLTIMLIGNYDYFSPGVARDQGRINFPQDREVTSRRAYNLMEHLSTGLESFSEAQANILNQVSSSQTDAVKQIFREEVSKIRRLSREDLTEAAEQAIAFIPESVFEGDTSQTPNRNEDQVSPRFPRRSAPTDEVGIFGEESLAARATRTVRRVFRRAN
jgi:hypothetical protein